MLVWYRYRHNTSAARGDWQYYEGDVKELAEDRLESIQDRDRHEFVYGEHYRGVEIERIDLPPAEWLLKQSRENFRLARHYNSEAERYFELWRLTKTNNRLPTTN